MSGLVAASLAITGVALVISSVSAYLTLRMVQWDRGAAVKPSIRRQPARNPEIDSAMHSVWLHGDWRSLTLKMTTEEREAAADAVERHDRTYPPDDRVNHGVTDLRWWR